MEKILLAVGFRQLEEYLEKQLKKEFVFVGTTVYREGVIRAIGQKNPDIVVIRETLEGKENIMTIIYEIRTKFPKLRIVFIAGKREPGDALLATLVNYGVYDILQGEKIQAQEVVRLIRKKNEYKDVQHLQPVPILDEQRNQVLFQAPSAIVQEREIIKEIYIEQSNPIPAGYVPKEEIQKAPTRIEEDIRPVQVIPVEEVMASISSEPPVIEKEVIDKKLTEKKIVEESKVEPKVEEKIEPVKKEKKGLFDKKKTEAKVELKEEPKNEPLFTANIGGIATKQKILTFIGGKNGVGNTSVAFNTAVSLAQKGLKTIYLEFNERMPSVSYWYDLGHIEDGIDTALLALENQNDFYKVEDAIVNIPDLLPVKSMMQKNYKKFPKTLDFMFFSKKYLTKEKNEEINVDMRYSKELFLHLLFQMEYDFIILDVPTDIHHPVTTNALIYSNKVFFTVTEDVASIGYSIYNLNELSKSGINLDKKLYYIINKYEKSDLSLKEIEDWVQSKNLLTVPIVNKDFINANFIGLPVILYTRNSGLKNAFETIVKTIIQK